MFNTTRFMPPPRQHVVNAEATRLAVELRRELHQLQYEQQCNDPEQTVMSALPAYGFSAVLLYQPRMFSYALQTGRTYVPNGRVAGAARANSTLCPNADLTCVYEPWTQCTVSNLHPDTPKTHPLREQFEIEQDLFQMPKKYESLGWFWWAGQILNFATRPNARLQAMVRETKKKLRWTHPMIVMHVRRSDSCRTRATCQPLEKYFKEAERISETYGGIRDVYVATDGSEVIEELRKSTFSKQFDVRYLEWDRSGFDWMKNQDPSINVWLEPCHEKGICDGIADMFSMALDYELLADGDFHIGLFTSGAYRLPYALSVARKGCYTPFVSLDIPWCNHWGRPPMTWGGYENIMC